MMYADKIEIDLSRDEEFSEQALKLIQDYYMAPGEDSPQEAFARAALAYCEGDYDFAQRIYTYASKRWFMFASPVLSNAPRLGRTQKVFQFLVFLLTLGTTCLLLLIIMQRLLGCP
jgi:ribonucleoside-diphosphate reductase alpha chain